MATGTIKFFHDEKGYGFIITDDVDDDIFFHITDVDDNDPDLREGDDVKFDIKQEERGPRAVNLTRL